MYHPLKMPISGHLSKAYSPLSSRFSEHLCSIWSLNQCLLPSSDPKLPTA